MKKILEFLSIFFNKSSVPDLKFNLNKKDIDIILSCKGNQVYQLDSLTRYYEVNYQELLSRGIWLLSIMRDAEIDNKKIAIVSIDEESGKVMSFSPISLT